MSLAPTLTTLPQYPLVTDSPEEFNQEAYQYTVAMAQFTSEMQAFIAWVNTNVGFANILNISDAEYNVYAADINRFVRMTHDGEKTLTIRPNSTAALPANATWTYRNVGTSNLTIEAGGGVTITPPAGGSLVIEPAATISLIRVATDIFEIVGQTVASS